MRLLAFLLVFASAVSANEAWRNDVIYFVMLDRFADGDPGNNQGVDPQDPLAFHGGDLKGLRDNLDEIADLGATAVWITPLVRQVGPVPSEHGLFWGHHGYWADDFEQIDPRFGSEEELRLLVARAHDLGLKVILDVVYNHVGYGADWTRSRPEWLRQGEACGGAAETLCLSGLPDLRTELPALRAHLFDAHIGLAARVGLDGFRLDTVKHIPLDFWQAHRARVRADLGADFLLLGEVWDADKYLARPYFEGGAMDAITDFGFRAQTLRFLTGVSGAERYGRYLARRHDVPEGRLLAPFLSSHDMPMLLAMLRGDAARLRIAAVLMLTSEGLPIITWGEELGRRGKAWPLSREDMPWGARQIPPGAGAARDEALRRDMQALIALRRARPALTGSAIEIVHAEGRQLAYRRGGVLVLINAGPEPWGFAPPGFDPGAWRALYGAQAGAAPGALAPHSAQILVCEGCGE